MMRGWDKILGGAYRLRTVVKGLGRLDAGGTHSPAQGPGLNNGKQF